VLTYLFAARYGNDPQEAASIVVISTIISIVALPLFLLSVL
jgi:predicted permease